MEQKEKLIFLSKPSCSKCEDAHKLLDGRLEAKYDVQFMSIGEADGLAEATFHGIQFFPAIVLKDKVYTVMKIAEKELL